MDFHQWWEKQLNESGGLRSHYVSEIHGRKHWSNLAWDHQQKRIDDLEAIKHEAELLGQYCNYLKSLIDSSSIAVLDFYHWALCEGNIVVDGNGDELGKEE